MQSKISKFVYLTILVSLSSCQLGTKSPRTPSGGEMTGTLPNNGDNFNLYFAAEPGQGVVRLFNGATKSGDLGAAECTQYMILTGEPTQAICNYVATPDAIQTQLELFKEPSASRFLALDQVLNFDSIDYSDSAHLPQITRESSRPFSVLLYGIDLSDTSKPVITIFNPAYISTTVMTDDSNTSSILSKYPNAPGWYVTQLIKLADDLSVSSERSFITLDTNQFGGVKLNLDPTKLPRVAVVAKPSGFNGRSPESEMSTVLTDQYQMSLRDGRLVGPVNPLSGEARFSKLLLGVPSLEGSPIQGVEAVYSSFNVRYGDFGPFWSLAGVPERANFSFVSPIGDIQGNYPFIFENGLSHFLGQNSNGAWGLFWPLDLSAPQRWATDLLYGVDNPEIQDFTIDGRIMRRTNPQNKNSTYYLYQGGDLAIQIDQVAARSNRAEISTVIDNLVKAGRENAGSENIFSLRRAAQTSQIKKLTVYPGTYIYHQRAPNGQIQKTILKDGTHIEYNYDAGRLSKVIKWDPGLNKNPTHNILYEFSYENSEHKNEHPVWGALVTQVRDHVSGLKSENFKLEYQVHPEQYGLVPVVSFVDYRQGSVLSKKGNTISFQYNFDPALHDGQSSSVVSFATGPSFQYFFNRGFVNKITGPSTHMSETVLFEAVRDPKSLRIVDQRSLGQETIVHLYQGYFQDDILVETCSDRTANVSEPTEALMPQMAQVDENGEIIEATLKCDDQSRMVTMKAPSIEPYFLDPTGTPEYIVTESDTFELPNANGSLENRQKKISRYQNGCVSTLGSSTVNGKLQSGEFCDFVEHPRGGRTLVHRFKTTDEVGGLMQELKGSLVDAGNCANAGSCLDLDSNFKDLLALNQAGFLTNLPTLGFDQVGTPSGKKSLNSITQRAYGPQGELLRETFPWVGLENRRAKTYYIYDYRGPTPRLLKKESVGIAPIVNGSTKSGNGGNGGNGLPPSMGSTRILDAMMSAVLEDGGSRPLLTQSLQSAFWPGGQPAIKQIAFKKSFDDEGRVNQVWGDSRHTYYLHDEFGRLASIKSTVRIDSGLGWREDITRFDYDDHDLLMKKTLSDGRIQIPIYNTDLSIAGWIEDKTNMSDEVNAGKETTVVLQYDFSGRPLQTKTAVELNASARTDGLPTYTETTYTPFGEVESTSKCLSACSSRAYISQTDFEYNLKSGILLRSSSSSIGISLDETTEQTAYRGFNAFLRPEVSEDETRHIVTETSGSPSTALTTTVYAPSVLGAYNVDYSHPIKSEIEKVDGCGNTIERSQLGKAIDGSSATIVTKTNIEYDNGLCRTVSSESPRLNSAGRSWKVLFHYLNDGTRVGESDSSPDSHDLTTIRLMRSLVVPSPLYTDPEDQLAGGDSRSLFVEAAQINHQSNKGIPQYQQYALVRATDEIFNANGIALETTEFLPNGLRQAHGKDETLYRQSDKDLNLGEVSQISNPLRAMKEQIRKDSSGNDLVNFFSDRQLDPVLGAPRVAQFQKRSPLTGASLSSNETHSYLPTGKVRQSLVSKIGRDTDLEILEWARGTPSLTVENVSSGSDFHMTTTVSNDDFVLNQPVESHVQRVVQSSSGNYTNESSALSVFDGVGRSIHTTYSEKLDAIHNFADSSTEVGTTYDGLGNVGRLIVTDTATEGQISEKNWNMGSSQHQKLVKRLPESPLSVDVTMKLIPSGFQMNYENFEVKYTLDQNPNQNTNSILFVSVKTPTGESYTFSPLNGQADYADDPYVGLVDDHVGELADGWSANPWNWFGDHQTLQAKLQENPSFSVTTAVDRDVAKLPDDFMRNINMLFTGGVLTEIQGTGARKYVSSADAIFSSKRSDLKDRGFGCDPIMANPAPGRTYSSAMASGLKNTDYFTRYSARDNRVASARRAHYFDYNTAQENAILVEQRNAYDAFGLPAFSETIALQKDQPNDPIWLHQNWRVSIPAPAYAQWSQQFLTLVEHVRRVHSETQSWSNRTPGLDEQTNYVHIYGPTGVIFSFYFNGTEWIKQDHIRDLRGNIIAVRQNKLDRGLGTVPSEIETYYPSLGSVIHRYLNVRREGAGADQRYMTDSVSSADGFPATNSTISRSGFDPLDPPTMLFGPGGMTRDLLFTYFDGETYEPYTGEALSLHGSAEDSVCSGQHSALLQAASAYFDIARDRRNIDKAGERVPSLAARAEAAQITVDWKLNRPSWADESATGAGMYALAWFHTMKDAGLSGVIRDENPGEYFLGAVGNSVFGGAIGAETEWGAYGSGLLSIAGLIPGVGFVENLINAGSLAVGIGAEYADE